MPDASIASGFGIYITIWYALLQTIIYRWYFITTYGSSHLLKFFSRWLTVLPNDLIIRNAYT